MTLSRDWKSDEVSKSSSSQMPRLSLLTRPMVGSQNLRIRGYEIKGLEMMEQETKAITPTSNLKYMEIQPIESTHLLIFSEARGKPGRSMNIQDIVDIKTSHFTRGRFIKKEDLVVEIRSLGPEDRRQYLTIIDVDDKYADEIVGEVMASKQAELNSNYWSHRSLTFTKQNGQKNTVDIYPAAPFLANGEEILWHYVLTESKDKKSKVIWINAVTNYRIFQYNYHEHTGVAILFPSLEDVKVNNEQRGSGLGIYNLTSPNLTGIQTSGAIGIVGEIVFYAEGSPWITFTRVNDPETLSNVVKTLNQQLSNIQIGDGESGQTKEQTQAELHEAIEDLGEKATTLSCPKCGKPNPSNSNFCNYCGSPFSPSCSKCGHSNPSGALFCGKCGSKLSG